MSAEPAASAAKAIGAALLRHALTAAGATLVAHRYVDQATADSAIGPIGDYVLGAALTLGSAGWGMPPAPPPSTPRSTAASASSNSATS